MLLSANADIKKQKKPYGFLLIPYAVIGVEYVSMVEKNK